MWHPERTLEAPVVVVRLRCSRTILSVCSSVSGDFLFCKQMSSSLSLTLLAAGVTFGYSFALLPSLFYFSSTDLGMRAVSSQVTVGMLGLRF